MIKFRDYQTDIIEKASKIISRHRFVYLAMEVRTGKTLTSLGIAERIGMTNVLFITKKKAISSIEHDYELLNPGFRLTVINYESLHKLPTRGWDLIVADEAHGMGAFPKPSGRAKRFKEFIFHSNPYVIFLSGTPTPEAYSQMYHQVYSIPNNPFRRHKSFYKFAHEYVHVTKLKVGGMFVNDYSRGSEKILEEMKPYTIRFTQKDAGFVVDTKEHILEVDMSDAVKGVIKTLKKDLVVQGKDEVILADTARS
jgi:hypothetical protein